MEDIKWVLEEIFFEAGRLASLALTIEMALIAGEDGASDFIGAAHILTDLLSAHTKKLEAFLE